MLTRKKKKIVIAWIKDYYDSWCGANAFTEIEDGSLQITLKNMSLMCESTFHLKEWEYLVCLLQCQNYLQKTIKDNCIKVVKGN